MFACNNTGLVATGIPPHLVLAVEVNQMNNRLQKLEERVDNYENTNNVRIDNIPAACGDVIVNKLRENFTIEGVAPITRTELAGMFTTLERNITETVKSQQQPIPCTVVPPPAISSSAPITQRINIPTISKWKIFSWENRTEEFYVPYDFRFPRKCSVPVLYILWFHGHVEKEIRPSCFLRRHLDICREDETVYSRAASVMRRIEEIVEQHHLVQDGQSCIQLNQTDGHNVVSIAFGTLLQQLYQIAPPKSNQLSYITIYGKITDTSNVTRRRKRRINGKDA